MPRANETQRMFSLANRLSLMPMLWWEMYWAATETITYRLAAMAAGGLKPGAWQRRENVRMVQEKAQAGLETAQALAVPNPALAAAIGEQWLSSMRYGFEASSRLLSGSPERFWMLAMNWPLLMTEAAADSMDVAVKPWRRRVTANAKRLRKRRG